jgi:hypothetical protein
VCEHTEDGTDLLKCVELVRDDMDVFVICEVFGIINEYFKHNAWTKCFKVIIGYLHIYLLEQ